MTRLWNRLCQRLAAPVDGASLAFFRVAFGLVMVWEAVRFLWPKQGLNKVTYLFGESAWQLPYHNFEWVVPLPEPGMTLLFVAMALAGACVAAGIYFRAAAAAMLVGFTYIFLLEEATYLNHFYLMCLLSFLLLVTPAHTCFSFDRWRGATARNASGAPLDTVPFWSVFILRAQLFIVYFYAGIAKLEANWLSGEAMWSVAQKTINRLVAVLPAQAGAWFTSTFDYKTIAQFLSVGGLVFDLAIGFLLLYRRTRLMAIVLCGMFHAFNNFTFSIGVFPLMAFTATLIFFECDWPRRAWAWLKRPRLAWPDWTWFIGGAVCVPVVGALLGWKLEGGERAAAAAAGGANRDSTARSAAPAAGISPLPAATRWAIAFVCVWVVFHVLWPLRHYAIPGDANWTEEGHRFSWRMMLRTKQGYAQFRVSDPALLVTSADGQTEINWNAWSKGFAPVLHEPVDAFTADWTRLPEFVVLFEPHAGERIIINPRHAGRHTLESARAWLDESWRELYGRRPNLALTVSVSEALAEIARHVESDGEALTGMERELRDEFRDSLDKAMALAENLPWKEQDRERAAVDLGLAIDRLIEDDRYGPFVHARLARTHPFSVLGRRHEGPAFLVVEDPALQRLNAYRRWEIDRQAWRGTRVVHLDLVRITHNGWLNLPHAIVYRQNEYPRIEWNYHKDLSPRQIKELGAIPFMMHQYAQRIAGQWKDRFGRRPAVYVAASVVTFNHRPAQPIVDPRVDLASAPINLFWRNDWILPLVARGQQFVLPSLPPDRTAADGFVPRPAGADLFDAAGRIEMVTARLSNGQKLTERQTQYRDGKSYTVTRIWNESGQLSAEAEYLNGVQHGIARTWHPNGRPAMQAEYRIGLRHGPAAAWYEDGRKAWRAEFVYGQRSGTAIAWLHNGELAERGEYRGDERVGAWTAWDDSTGEARRVEFGEGTTLR